MLSAKDLASRQFACLQNYASLCTLYGVMPEDTPSCFFRFNTGVTEPCTPPPAEYVVSCAEKASRMLRVLAEYHRKCLDECKQPAPMPACFSPLIIKAEPVAETRDCAVGKSPLPEVCERRSQSWSSSHVSATPTPNPSRSPSPSWDAHGHGEGSVPPSQNITSREIRTLSYNPAEEAEDLKRKLLSQHGDDAMHETVPCPVEYEEIIIPSQGSTKKPRLLRSDTLFYDPDNTL
jgi:hypothetical protein